MDSSPFQSINFRSKPLNFLLFLYIFAILFCAIGPCLGKLPEVLFSYGNSSLNGINRFQTSNQSLIDKPSEIGSFDYVFSDSLLFFVDKKRPSINAIQTGEIVGKRQEFSVIQDDVQTIECLACDWLTKKLYWVDTETNRLEVSDLDGDNRTLLISKGLEHITALALAPLDGIMFLSLWGEKQSIECISMNGDLTTQRTIVSNTVVYSIAVDHKIKKIYWADAFAKTIFSIGFNGENRRVVVSEKTVIHPYSVAVNENKVYWSDLAKNDINVCNKILATQRDTILMVDKSSTIRQMRIYNQTVQPYRDHPCAHNNGNCSNLCLLSSQSPHYSCNCPSGHAMKSDGRTCNEKIHQFLLVTRREDIKFISLDTEQYASVKIKVKGSKKASSIDFDLKEERIYWSDEFLGTINSAFLNGSDQASLISQDLDKVEAIALDWMNRNLYWVNSLTRRIEVSKLDGRYRSVIVSTHIEQPRGFAIHPKEGYFYWTDWGRKPKIEKTLLDGSSRIVLIDQNLYWPNGLTIDFQMNRIYWCDAKLHKIEYSNLDGFDRRELIASSKMLPHVYGITILDQYVYWTDWTMNTISRADKQHGGPEIIGERMRNLMGLKAVSLVNETDVSQTNCNQNNGQCSHLCFDLPLIGIRCGCPTGFELAQDGLHCVLGQDPCISHNGNCSHYCKSILGNFYICECDSDDVLDSDRRTCINERTSNRVQITTAPPFLKTNITDCKGKECQKEKEKKKDCVHPEDCVDKPRDLNQLEQSNIVQKDNIHRFVVSVFGIGFCVLLVFLVYLCYRNKKAKFAYLKEKAALAKESTDPNDPSVINNLSAADDGNKNMEDLKNTAMALVSNFAESDIDCASSRFYDRNCLTGASCSSSSKANSIINPAYPMPMNSHPYDFTQQYYDSGRKRKRRSPQPDDQFQSIRPHLCPYPPPPTPFSYSEMSSNTYSVPQNHSPPSSAFTYKSYPDTKVPPPSPVTERSFNKFQ